MSNATTSRREALRAQQQAAQRAARTRKMVGIGAIIVAGLLIAILVFALVNQSAKGGGAVVPPNATVNEFGVKAGTNSASAKDGIAVAPEKAKAGVPVVTLFADYQCPGCKAFDEAFGAQLNQLARSGDIKYSVQIETFLDRLGTNKSTDPAIAAACADVVGAFPEYHLTIFKGQPATEGDGYTADQLRNQFAATAGLSGDRLTQFQSCFDTRATASFVEQENKLNSSFTSQRYTELKAAGNSTEANAWGSTPLILVNGKRLDTATLTTDPTSIAAAITKLAA